MANRQDRRGTVADTKANASTAMIVHSANVNSRRSNASNGATSRPIRIPLSPNSQP
jgi:hypothetical protein